MTYPEHIMKEARGIFESVIKHRDNQNMFVSKHLETELYEVLDIAAAIQAAETRGHNQALEDVAGGLRDANKRIGAVSTPIMQGDNLAILLCSWFDDHENEEGELGWTAAANYGCEEVLNGVRDHYETAIIALKKGGE
jgi:hypothetical protein